MSASGPSHESALDAADQIRRYNVWRGVYESAMAGTLRLDGLETRTVDAGTIISLPDLKYPSLTIIQADADAGEPAKVYVTEREIMPNPWPNSTDQAMRGRTYILHESGAAPKTALVWIAVSGKQYQLLNELEANAYQTSSAELQHLDIVFGEIDEARRISFAKRAGYSMANDRKVTLGEKVGNLLRKHPR